MSNAITVSVLADVRNLTKGVDSVNSKLAGFGKSAGKVGSVLKGALAGAAIGGAFKSIVSAASDAQQSIGATESVFGKYSKSVIKSSKGAATEFGLSANVYRENANLLGSLFKNQGVATDQLAAKSKQFIGVGADLAATFGGTTTSAVEALSSALKGEFDPLERYGISIKQSSINAELAAKGQDKLTGAALKQAQQIALTNLVMKQSKSSLGAFGKESDTLAHQQQVLGAKFENIKATLGSAFLPILTKVAAFISDKMLPKFKEWGQVFTAQVLPKIKELGNFVKTNLLPPLKTLGDFLANNKTVVATFAGVILTVVAAMRIWAAVQAILNVVMSANPIGLVVIAIAALAAGLVYAYKHSETFRNIVNSAFSAIKRVISAVMPVVTAVVRVAFRLISVYVRTYVAVVRAVITTAWNVIKTVTRVAFNLIKNYVVNPIRAVVSFVKSAVGNVKSAVTNGWSVIKSKTAAVWNGLRTVVSNAIGKVVALARGIKAKIVGAFSGAAGWLASAGRNIISGLIGGITAMARNAAGAAVRVVQGAIKAAKGALGIHSPSRVFAEIGRYTSLGLAQGLGDTGALRKVTAAAGNMTGAIESGFSPALSLVAGSSTSSQTLTIKLSAQEVSQLQRGAEYKKDITAFEKSGGR